jgi:hypothetical protein
MANRKGTKGQTMIYKTLEHYNLSNMKHTKNWEIELRCSGMVGRSCYISVTPEFIDSCFKSGELYFSHIHVENKLIDSKSCRFKVKFRIDI